MRGKVANMCIHVRGSVPHPTAGTRPGIDPALLSFTSSNTPGV